MAARHTTTPPCPVPRRSLAPDARRRAQLRGVLAVARTATERAAAQTHDLDVRQLAEQALRRLRLAELLTQTG